jgi:hypothetical protein
VAIAAVRPARSISGFNRLLVVVEGAAAAAGSATADVAGTVDPVATVGALRTGDGRIRIAIPDRAEDERAAARGAGAAAVVLDTGAGRTVTVARMSGWMEQM